MKKLYLSSSMMCSNLFNLKEDLTILKKHKFDYIHLDIMDGHFVPNIAFGFDLVNKIDELVPFLKDIHLMMDYPEMAVRNLKLKCGDMVSFHIECRSDPNYTIQQIKDKNANVKVGIVINPDTPIENIYPFLDKVDLVLIMTVHPGFAGHPFVKTSYERVRILSEYIKEKHLQIIIGVDGAIGLQEIIAFNQIGVRLFVLGTTALFKGNLEEQVILVSKFIKKINKSSKQ